MKEQKCNGCLFWNDKRGCYKYGDGEAHEESLACDEWTQDESEVLTPKQMEFVSRIGQLFNISFSFITVYYRNRGGWVYAKAPGFSYTVCTSSLADGPDCDYSKELNQMFKGLGYRLENSYGDNGMDSASNWHDTFWTYEFAYDPKAKEY